MNGQHNGFQADALDQLLFAAFPGLVMRKDLTQALRGMSKAPSYVLEFMLGKYCADLFDEESVREGLELVQEEVARYIPRGDETEVIKASIRQRPPRRLIDLVQVTLDERLDSGVYWASLVTANIHNVNIHDKTVEQYNRLLTAGIWCNLLVNYDDTYRYRGQTFPFVIQRLEPVQVGRVDLDEFNAARAQFTRDQWIDALIRTMGYEPQHPALTQRVKLLYLVRMIPLVEANYHLIELGPRQTGKSFCFTELSPYGTLLAGGAVSVPKELAADQGLQVGTPVVVDFVGVGPRDTTVGAVVDSAFFRGNGILIDQTQFDEVFPATQQTDLQVYVRLADDADRAGAATAIDEVVDRFPPASLQDLAAFTEAQTAPIDRVVFFIWALLLLAVVISIIGVLNTLLLSVYERTRELGLLRAAGMSRRQVRASIRWETVVITLIGTVVGITIGLSFGWTLVRAGADEGFSAFGVPWLQVAIILGVAWVAGLLASLWPARRAARLDVLAAIAHD